MKLNYKNQLILSCIIIVLFDVLNMLFKQWIFTSIAFCICGLLWIINPVPPKKASSLKHIKIAIRVVGILLILIGILTRAYF